jgi:hypothetical protein
MAIRSFYKESIRLLVAGTLVFRYLKGSYNPRGLNLYNRRIGIVRIAKYYELLYTYFTRINLAAQLACS